MSNTKRQRYSTEFKAKLSLEAIKGEQTISELSSRYVTAGSGFGNGNSTKPFYQVHHGVSQSLITLGADIKRLGNRVQG